MIARPYQTQALDGIDNALASHRSTLCVMGTGLGKTVVAGHVVKKWMDKGRVLFLAHREELLTQAQAKISAVTGYWPGMEKAEHYANMGMTLTGQDGEKVIVSSVQTQVAGTNGWRRMKRFKPDEFSLVIIDEAHRTRADSYHAILDHYFQNENLKLLGITATPNRTDKKAMGVVYESVAFEYGASDGVTDGWLVKPKMAYTTIHGLDLSNVRVSGGDLHQGDLAAVMEFAGPLNQVAKATIDDCSDRKTIVFTVSVDQARMLTEILNQHKPGSAKCVTGKTEEEERRQMMRDFRTGRFQYLVNVAVLVEGIDVPDVSAVVMARPTKSKLIFAQQVGRGMRPLDGLVDVHDTSDARLAAILASNKPDLLVVDFVGNTGRHKLCRVTDILGGKYSEKVRELAERKLQTTEAPQDVTRALADAEKEITAMEREAAAKLAEDRARARKTVKWIDPFDAYDIAPVRDKGWGGTMPATPGQVRLLEKFKINCEGMGKREAGLVISKIMERKNKGLCSGPQMQLLKRYGYDATHMPADEAGRLITAIRDNGWRPLANVG